MQFTQSFRFEPIVKSISYSQPLMSIGSCFAETMGNKLQQSFYNVLVNPAGIVFNPLSIAQQLQYCIQPQSFDAEKYLFSHNGLWHSWLHHGKFSEPQKEEVGRRTEQYFQEAATQLRQATHLIITWGSAWVYQRKENNAVVANCHKVPASAFEKRLLRIDEIVSAYELMLQQLKELNPSLNFIWSVSPVKYVREGLHENNLSKSVLHLAMHQLIQNKEEHYYFPAFEILQDELRDYRFYDKDLAHPSSLATDYIWLKFREHCLNPAEAGLFDALAEIRQAMQHRPLHKDTESYRNFMQQYVIKTEQLMRAQPYLNLSEALAFFKAV